MGFSLLLLLQLLPWQAAQATADPVVFTGPAQVSLVRGKPEVIELRFRIRDGLHINSHAPRDKSLIRTELIVAEPAGLDVQAVDFPPGAEYASRAFPNEKLSVYTGEVVLRARVTATVAGQHPLAGALRYQACDADTCFPPKRAEMTVEVMAQ